MLTQGPGTRNVVHMSTLKVEATTQHNVWAVSLNGVHHSLISTPSSFLAAHRTALSIGRRLDYAFAGGWVLK